MKAIKTKVTMLSVAVLTATSGGAWAQEAPKDIGELADNISGMFGSIVKLGLGGAFMVGVYFVIMGIMRLKAAADSQGQQVKYSEGLWRLGVAAALCGVPAILTLLGGSAGIGTGGGEQLLQDLNSFKEL